MTIIRVIDFETTGLKPPAEVCEVGWCDYSTDDRVIGPPQSEMYSVEKMPPEARAVHHIGMDELAGHPRFDSARAARSAEGVVSGIAAHNMDFEAQWMARDSAVPLICTYKVALRKWPTAPSHGNQVLRYWLEDRGLLNMSEPSRAAPPHRAGPDAYVTAHILRALFAEGVTGKEMVAWTREPRLLPVCPLGKMRGKPWPEVDNGFLQWMLKQADMEDDLKWNAQRELDLRAK